MQNSCKTREQLLAEIEALRLRVAELEAAQVESERRHTAMLRGLLEHVPMGVHLYDLQPDGRLVFVGANSAADRILGTENAQFIGQTIEEAFPPLLKTEVPARYRCAAAKGVSWENSHIAFENGTIAGAFQVYAFPTWPGSMAALFMDVTERKRLETQVQQANNRLLALIENLHIGVLFENEARQILHTNQTFCDLFGIPAPDLVLGANCTEAGQAAKSLFADPEGFVRGIDVRLAAREPVLDEKLTLIDGRTFERSYVPVLRGTERHGHLWIYRDVSEQVRLYQERVRAEKLLSAMNRAALSVVKATTPGEVFAAAAGELGSLGLTCTAFALDESKNCLQLVYIGHETAQVKALELLAEIDHPQFVIPIQAIENIWQVLLDKQSLLIEDTAEALRPLLPGSSRHLAGDIVQQLNVPKTIVTALLEEKRVLGLLLVQGQDLNRKDLPAITAFAHQIAAAWHKADLMQSLQGSLEELKRTQAQLIQAQKMEAVGRLAGGVAHDFNNHLTAIHGYAEMVLLQLDPQDPRRQDVYEIQQAAERSTELTRQLLAFSRKQVIQPRVMDLNSLIKTMRRMLERLIGEDITLHTVLAPQLEHIQADPGQIEQVVMNLAVNARDAVDEKSRSSAAPFVAHLTIETANVELDEAYPGYRIDIEPGPYVMLSVSDNGIGMDQEIMSHLFEPFFTTKEQGRGTGLGLATVYGIVKQNNGYVFPYSEPGVGTTFKIYLPRVEGETITADQTTASAAVPSSGETILIVEDEDAVRALARRILSGRGYRILEAANTDSALYLCEQHSGPIHLVLTDVVVPGLLSSKELVGIMIQARPEIRVIYMSGYTDDVIAHHGVLDPDIRFVEKPFTPNTLALKVREVLDENDA